MPQLPFTIVVSPLAQLTFAETGAEERRVGMAVDVEEAGRHAEARRVDRPRSACTGQIAPRAAIFPS